MGLKLFINLPPTVTNLSHIKVLKAVHKVCYFTPLYKNFTQRRVLNCLWHSQWKPSIKDSGINHPEGTIYLYYPSYYTTYLISDKGLKC
jgi:hypothetical protein